MAKAAKQFYYSPSASLTLSSSPVSRWSLWVQYKLGVQCRTPSRSDRFNGVTGGAGGPKGRNRNLPWPPCKKVIKKLICFLFISTPQSRLAPCQLPGRGAFWCALQLKHSHGRPPMTAPTTLHINFWNNQGDASRPHNFTISHAHPPSGGFHIAQAIFHCASAQFHPFARTDFTARVSALIFRIRRFQR